MVSASHLPEHQCYQDADSRTQPGAEGTWLNVFLVPEESYWVMVKVKESEKPTDLGLDSVKLKSEAESSAGNLFGSESVKDSSSKGKAKQKDSRSPMV